MMYTLCILLSMWNFPYGLGLSRISRQFETKRKIQIQFLQIFHIYLYIVLSDLQEFKLMCKNLSQEQVRGSRTWRMYSFNRWCINFFICFRLRLHLINTTLLATRCSIIKSSAKWFTTRRSMNINEDENANSMSYSHNLCKHIYHYLVNLLNIFICNQVWLLLIFLSFSWAYGQSLHYRLEINDLNKMRV